MIAPIIIAILYTLGFSALMVLCYPRRKLEDIFIWFCLFLCAFASGACVVGAATAPDGNGMIKLRGKTYKCIEVKKVESWEPVVRGGEVGG